MLQRVLRGLWVISLAVLLVFNGNWTTPAWAKDAKEKPEENRTLVQKITDKIVGSEASDEVKEQANHIMVKVKEALENSSEDQQIGMKGNSKQQGFDAETSMDIISDQAEEE